MNTLTVVSRYEESDKLSVEIVLNVGTISSETWYKLDSPIPSVSSEFFENIAYPIASFLRSKGANERDTYSWTLARLMREYAGVSLSPDQPKIAKRISKFVKEQFGHNLPDDILADIGNKANKYRNDSYLLCVTRDLMFPLHDSYYGDEDACFHAGNAHYKGYLDKYGAYALLWRKPNGNPHARAWAINERGSLGIFNHYSYGNLDSEAMARLMAECIGGVHYATEHSSVGSSMYEPYLNDSEFWVVDSPESERLEYFPLRFTSAHAAGVYARDYRCDDPSVECAHCGDGIPEEEAMYSEHGNGPYCESCYSELYGTCEHCGAECSRDDLCTCHKTINGDECEQELCWHCREHGDYVECCECGAYWHMDETISTEDDKTYCRSCGADKVAQCAHCEELYTADDMYSLSEDSDDLYCVSCLSSEHGYAHCMNCHSFHAPQDLTVLHVMRPNIGMQEFTLCSDCAPKIARMNPGLQVSRAIYKSGAFTRKHYAHIDSRMDQIDRRISVLRDKARAKRGLRVPMFGYPDLTTERAYSYRNRY